MRRRPLLRTAAVGAVAGGVAYHAGKSNAQNEARMQQLESDVQSTQQPAYATQQPAYAPAPAAAAPAQPPPAAPMGPQEQVEALERLGQLRDSGVLTPEEFALQKARILSS